MWFSQLGYPHNNLKFPYKRQSPLTKRNKTYNNIDDVWDDINLLIESWKESKFSLGRNLYFHLPLFMDPKLLYDNEDNIVFKEYHWCKDFNIPIAKSLNDADAFTLELFDIIRSEINQIEKYVGEKNGT